VNSFLKLTVTELLKKFPALYGIQRLLTPPTRASHRWLTRLKLIQSRPTHLIFQATLHYIFQAISSFPVFRLKCSIHFSSPTSALLLRPWFDHRNNKTEHYTLLSSSSRNSVLWHYLPLTSKYFPSLSHRIKSVLSAVKLTLRNNVPLLQRFNCFRILQTAPNKKHRNSITRWYQSYLPSTSHPHNLSPYDLP